MESHIHLKKVSKAVKKIRVAAAQTSELIGELEQASKQVVDLVERAKDFGARLICFPEGYLQGYVLSENHIQSMALSSDSPEIQNLIASLPKHAPTLIIGFIESHADGFSNSAAVIQDKRLVGCYRKVHLLSDETVFTSGHSCPVFETDGLKFGIAICNDMNFPETVGQFRDCGADLVACCANNMLPRQIAEEWKTRHNEIRAQRCQEAGVWILSADVTGERGDYVGWGPTSLLNPFGEVVAELPLEQPGLLLSEIDIQ